MVSWGGHKNSFGTFSIVIFSTLFSSLFIKQVFVPSSRLNLNAKTYLTKKKAHNFILLLRGRILLLTLMILPFFLISTSSFNCFNLFKQCVLSFFKFWSSCFIPDICSFRRFEYSWSVKLTSFRCSCSTQKSVNIVTNLS